ncbi:MAG: ferrous iron transport protein B [Clostridiales bacterium]|nr:ferrous iron transport protein B [Clostridiales bacterium]
MGLTYKTVKQTFETKPELNPNKKVIALAGNPNVGKSTVFNALTGLKQHTGNWPGKTIANAKGTYTYNNQEFLLVDIPGTYSLFANSAEEEIARNFICFEKPDVTIIVVDATCLERNLNLVLQTLEITKNVVICVNLIDEAKKKKIQIDFDELTLQLGVPVIPTSARSKIGLDKLVQSIHDICFNNLETRQTKIVYPTPIENAINLLTPTVKNLINNILPYRWVCLRLLDKDSSLLDSINKILGFDLKENQEIKNILNEIENYFYDYGINNIRDEIVTTIVKKAEQIANFTVFHGNKNYNQFDNKLDKIFTSKITGIPIMIGLLGIIFWLTISLANYPSEILSTFLFNIQDYLTYIFEKINAPEWLHGVLVLGLYRTVAWVVSVMLPPMAIFFPLFTLLEDSGYLPRIAFNLDNYFKKAYAHGKQALTMCMGFGCNACGVTGCRIIDSPRERLVAILTNNFVPCNGRFPILIAIITMFFASTFVEPFNSIFSTLILLLVIIISVIATLLVTKILSKTLLKGVPSSFALELPPYRKPQICKVIVRSIFDRTLFVLLRSIMVAAPAGILIWCMANLTINDISILNYCTNFLDPFAQIIGLDGVILMAFILGFPANEIVIPIIIMSYMSSGNLVEYESLIELKELLINNGWTITTAICTMLFTIFHFPCGTTCLTIKKETGSIKWTFVSFIVPTMLGIASCFIVNLIMGVI